jgi:hypothetical protein
MKIMKKSEVDWCKKIEIWWLLRDIKEKNGYKYTTISWGDNGSRGSISVQVSVCNEEKYARFIYTQTDNNTGTKENFDYKVPIIETPCHFGNTRYWFKCPLYKNGQYCGRRIGVLYKDGDWFGCRHCYNLSYSSQNENKKYKYYPLFRLMDLEMKMEKLYKKAKRKTYGGKLTKKWKKIAQLDAEITHYYKQIKDT